MCATCGCGNSDEHPEHDHHLDHDHGHDHRHAHGHDHHHGHDHDHDHHHHDPPAPERTIPLEQAILAKNARLAAENRDWLAARHLTAINLMSSPGAGKTTLLERTIRDLGGEVPLAVIEGDQETARDAERIRTAGCRAVQINTGTGCHLDAAMVAGALRTLDPPPGAFVFIENVGNLVCPALFELGERRRVVIVSVTEGEDKPLKYPHMFRAADLVLLSKVDLLPHVDVDAERLAAHARRLNPAVRVLPLSPTRGDGLDAWYAWLRSERGARAVAG